MAGRAGNGGEPKEEAMRLSLLRLAAACMAACILAAGCGGADEPQEVVRRFYEAVGQARVEGNDEALAEAREIMDRFFVDQAQGASQSLEFIGLMVSFAPMLEYTDMRYELVEQEGDHALVRVSGTMVMNAEGMRSSEPIDAEFPLQRVDGTWRIRAVR
jgi:hypothetical protein